MIHLLKNGSTVVTDGDSPVFQPKSKKGTSLPLELGWKWEFESTVLDDSDGSIKKAVDKLDTALASKSGKTIDFNLKVDIQQYNG